MNVNFFDDDFVNGLYPLTLTRPAADLRIGILTIAQKWQNALKLDNIGFQTAEYLSNKFAPCNADLSINGRVLPSANLINAVTGLKAGEYLQYQEQTIAVNKEKLIPIEFLGEIDLVARPYHIFLLAGTQIVSDMQLLQCADNRSELHVSNTVFGDHTVHIATGASIYAATLNATEGPIYVGNNATIMEGSMVRGNFAMGQGAVLKMGAKVYKDCALGPYSVVGGEISNVVFQGYSNKGHDGFLGNAVLGEWCNIGADSNCSNLKNNYDDVKLWNYATGRFDKSDQQFCGLIMGDHSKCGINTMFNTGTVVGVACNIFGSGFPRNVVQDFSWGGAAAGFVPHKFEQACKTASLVMPRRKMEFNEIEKQILHYVYEHFGLKN